MDNTQMLDKVRTCPGCGSHAVALVAWEEVPVCPEWPGHWIVDLLCGECECMRTDIFSQEEVDLFDEWLDDEHKEIEKATNRFARQNMEEWVDRFKRMLELDVILPDDFKSSS